MFKITFDFYTEETNKKLADLMKLTKQVQVMKTHSPLKCHTINNSQGLDRLKAFHLMEKKKDSKSCLFTKDRAGTGNSETHRPLVPGITVEPCLRVATIY